MGRHKNVLGVAVVLLLAVGSCMGQEPLTQNGCGSQTVSCSQCIQYHPDCVWCPSPPRTSSMNMQVRCQNRTLGVTCSTDLLVQDPRSSVNLTENEDNPSDFRVRPQVVEITARPGDTQFFNLTVQPTNDFPLDLYILMDFSASLDRPLQTLREIALNITVTLENITENFQIGFGTFVDKRTLPFTLTSLVQILLNGNESCLSGRSTCVPTYSYLHQLSMTSNVAFFQDVLDRAELSGNVDNPEGGLDALVQAAVCGSIIGWRPSALHMLLYFTDNEYHIAGDGRLAGVVRPNDGQCHIEPREEDGFYDYVLDTIFDYPSIYQLNSLLIENEIIPVFANTNPDFVQSYSTLAGLLDSSQSVFIERTEQLTSIIQEAYNDLTRVVNPVPQSIDGVTFRVEPLCDNPTEDGGCTATINQDATFRISVTLEACTDALQDGATKTLTIRVPGFGSTDIVLAGICNCDCEEDTTNSVPNNEACSSNGTLVCGLCVCNEGRFGTTCQCTEQINPCPEVNGVECAGNGVCDGCNECVCNQQPDSENFFFGSDCSCDDNSCPQFNGMNCGGPERGVCDCDTLTCMCLTAQPSGVDYFGMRGACECDPNNCFNEAFPDGLCQNIAGGESGTCSCNVCVCPEDFENFNRTCRPTRCLANRPCARCAAGLTSGLMTVSGREQPCAELEATCNSELINVADTVPGMYRPCSIDNDTCALNRSYFVPPNQDDNLPILVQECNVVSGGVEVWIIAAAIVGGILLLGLLILIIIKLILLILERIDYNRFVKQMEEADWAPHENPLYLSPQQDFKNVAYKKRGGTRN